MHVCVCVFMHRLVKGASTRRAIPAPSFVVVIKQITQQIACDKAIKSHTHTHLHRSMIIVYATSKSLSKCNIRTCRSIMCHKPWQVMQFTLPLALMPFRSDPRHCLLDLTSSSCLCVNICISGY